MFSIPVSNKSSYIAFLCPQNRNNFRKKNHSDLHRGQWLSFSERENEFSCLIIPRALLSTFKCMQSGLCGQPNFLRANFRRGFVLTPRHKKMFSAFIRSK
jgi:hypothetical protein